MGPFRWLRYLPGSRSRTGKITKTDSERKQVEQRGTGDPLSPEEELVRTSARWPKYGPTGSRRGALGCPTARGLLWCEHQTDGVQDRGEET